MHGEFTAFRNFRIRSAIVIEIIQWIWWEFNWESTIVGRVTIFHGNLVYSSELYFIRIFSNCGKFYEVLINFQIFH